MIEYLDYQETENTVSVGFKKYDFLVYAQMGKGIGLMKADYLKLLYIKAKPSIDYEEQQYNNGQSNSIVTDRQGELFIPDSPTLSHIKLEIEQSDKHIEFTENQLYINIPYKILLLDQYDQLIDVPYSVISTHGDVENGYIKLEHPIEPLEVTVSLAADSLTDEVIINLYPYLELESAWLEHFGSLNTKILELQAALDAIIGGEVIEQIK